MPGLIVMATCCCRCLSVSFFVEYVCG